MRTELTVQPLPHPDPDGIDPMSHFIDTINEYALYNRDVSDNLNLTITNDQNVGDEAVEISFRRNDFIRGRHLGSI
jgi:hypothetical protein